MAAVPPYTDHDDPKGGLKCYLCEHVCKGSWESIITHLRKKHGINKSDIKGTVLLAKARQARFGHGGDAAAHVAAVSQEQQFGHRAAATLPVDEPAATPTRAAILTRCSDLASPEAHEEMNQRDRSKRAEKAESAPPPKAEAAPAAAAARPAANAIPDCVLLKDPAVRISNGEVMRGSGGTYWRAMWVQHLNGVPVVPASFQDIDNFELTATHGPIAVKSELGTPPAQTAVPNTQMPVPSSPLLQLPPPSQTAVPNVRMPVPSSQPMQTSPPSQLDRVEQLVQNLSGNKEAWKKEIPVLRIAPGVAECSLPPAKGEAGVKRANWPKELRCPTFEIEGFTRFYKHAKLAKHAGECHMRNVQRVFGMLEMQAGDEWVKIDTAELAGDVMLTVALLMEEMHARLLDLPIMDVKYSFAEGVVQSLTAFANWHVQNVADKLVQGESGHWEHNSAALHRLIAKLQNGYAKRLNLARTKKLLAKAADDTDTIKRLATIEEMRAGVETGFRILKGISKRYCNSTEPLPKLVQGTANACLVGAIWLDGFGGRKYEWEVMGLDHVVSQLEADLDFLLCPEHKTSRTYGTLAKWMSPGLTLRGL